MIKNKLFSGISALHLGAVIALISSVSHAQESLDWNVELLTTIESTDNALREDGQPIDEVQTTLGGIVNLDYLGKSVLTDIEYSVSETDYSEDTQSDTTEIIGSTLLTLGNLNDGLYGINFAHEKSRILVDPGAQRIISNTDDRDIFSVEPYVRFSPSKATWLTLFVKKEMTEFDALSQNETESDQFRLNFDRQINKTAGYSLSASTQDVNYRYSDINDYQQNQLSLLYHVQLGKIDYSIAVGAGEFEFQNEALESSQFSMASGSLSYEGDTNHFALEINKSTTNSSQGTGLNSLLNQNIQSGGDLSVQDLIDTVSLNTNYRTNIFCTKCFFELSGDLIKQEYQRTPTSNSDEYRMFTKFDYNILKNVSSSLGYAISKIDFENNPQQELKLSELSLTLSSKINAFDLSFTAQSESVKEESGEEFDVNTLRFLLRYNFNQTN